MVRFVIVFVSCFLFLITSGDVRAHAAGQPPFFKVNGRYSPLYPVPTTSLTDFPLPQDTGPENYLVNEPIVFEIDSSQLAVPQDIFARTKFTWDFGDGGAGSGSKLSHMYSKPGSYFLKVNAEYESVSGSQLFQSIMVNVLPDANYQLPKAVIAVNDKVPKDPLVDILKFPFGQELKFDASKSSGGDSKIVEYFWDFGDSKSNSGASTSHTYAKDLVQQQVFPVLRVKTADGFIADNFAEIDNKSEGVSSVSKVSRVSGANKFAVIGVVLVVVAAVGFLVLRKRRGR